MPILRYTFVLSLVVLALATSLPAQDPNYYTVAEIEAAIDAQVAAHPARASKVNLSALPGGELTHGNRPIYALKVSDNVARDEDEPAILVAAQHHARELNSPVMVIGAMQRLLAGYGSDPQLTAVVDNYEVWFVPMVNPDGVDYVWNTDSNWRKNRRNNGGGSFGVDLNRNFEFLWGLCGSSSTTTSNTYRGPSAASEPETRTMRNLVAWLRPEIYLDVHSSGQEVLRTYAPCATVGTTIANFLERYIDDLRAPMNYAKRDPSASGEAPEDHWASGGALSFLIEVGTSFQPVFSVTQAEEVRVWPGIRRAFTAWRPARRGHVRSSLGNTPLEATITYSPNTFNHGEVTKSRERDGRYGLWLPLGSWNVTFAAAGHESQTIPVNVASYDTPVTLDVTLQPSCARYVPDNSASTGSPNQAPFGTPGGLSSLSTFFLGNNGGAIGGAIYFDISGINDCYLHGLELNTGIGAGTPIEADIYVLPGATFLGNETNGAAWTLWTAAKGTASVANTPSTVTFNRGLYIGAGSTYAVAIVARNFDHDYTSSPGGPFFGDTNLSMNVGSATNAPFTGPVFMPRIPNVTLKYRVDASSWHNTISQHVVRAAELGAAGRITGLSFAPSASGRHYNRVLRIRMAHKPSGYNLSPTFANNITGSTTVLNQSYYSWNVIANRWNQVGLTSTFDYNGTDDVVVEIFARGNHMSVGGSGGFRRGSGPRAVASGWAWNAQPATGAVDNGGTKMRVEFGCGGAGEYATSCGPTRAFHSGSPNPGSVFNYGLINAVPNSGAIVQLGFNRTSTSLTSSGFTGCWAWTDNVASVFKVVNFGGVALHPVAIPATPAFNGVAIYGQWFNFDGNAPGGLTATNVTRLMIGEAP